MIVDVICIAILIVIWRVARRMERRFDRHINRMDALAEQRSREMRDIHHHINEKREPTGTTNGSH